MPSTTQRPWKETTSLTGAAPRSRYLKSMDDHHHPVTQWDLHERLYIPKKVAASGAYGYASDSVRAVDVIDGTVALSSIVACGSNIGHRIVYI